MEEKKTIGNENTLWSLFGHRSINSNFLWRNFNPKLRSPGFTLIELLITIAIVGVLAAGIITVINPLTEIKKATDAKRRSDLSQTQKALEVYYNDNNSYPASVTFGASWNPYMSSVPQDPKSGRNYVYAFVDANTYRMYASLERPTDAPSCGGGVCSNAGALSCGAGGCTYGVTSPNTSP